MITSPAMFPEANSSKTSPVERLEYLTSLELYVASAFKGTRKVKVLSPHETVKEKSTFRVKALRREVNTDLLN